MSIDFSKYYEDYWKKRLKTKKRLSLGKFMPHFLIKYSNNGAIANQVLVDSKVLDLGCGNGEVSLLFLQKRCEVIGIDISNNTLKDAKDKGIVAIKYDLNKVPLPLEEKSFDVVVFADVIEHLMDPLSVLKDAYRVLKKEGIIIIYIPNFARLSNRIRMLKGDPIDVLHWDRYGDEIEHLHWFTKPKLEYSVLKVGFRKIKFIPVGLPFSFLFGIFGLPGLGRSLLLRGVKE